MSTAFALVISAAVLGTPPAPTHDIQIVADARANERCWWIFEGDSFLMASPTHRAYWEGLYRVGALPDITAHCVHGFFGSDDSIVKVGQVAPATRPWLQTSTADYLADHNDAASEQVGVPQGFARVIKDGDAAAGSTNLLVSHVPNAWPTLPSNAPDLRWPAMGARPTYYWLGSGNTAYTSYTLRGANGMGAALAAGVDLSLAARALWSDGQDPTLGVPGAPSPGRLNALWTDLLETSPTPGIAWCNAPSDTIVPDTGPAPFEALVVGPTVFYSSTSGAGNPVWEPGSMVTVRAGSSWSTWHHSEGQPQILSEINGEKSYTDDQLLAELDATCVDRTLRPVFVLTGDYAEFNHLGAAMPAHAPAMMNESQHWDAVFDRYAQTRRDVCEAIGLPDPIFLLIAPHYHWQNSAERLYVSPAGAATTDEDALAVCDMMADAMRRAAVAHPDVAFVSVLDLLGRHLLGTAASRDDLRDRGYNWIDLGPGIGTVDFTKGGPLMDADKIHITGRGSLLVGAMIGEHLGMQFAPGEGDPPPNCDADIDGSGTTDIFDFAVIASNFGRGPGQTQDEGDLNGDGFVDVFDFAELAEEFGCEE